ncbi:LuxR C-terminal-related transcriptional regulator [Isoptericola sediminis]|uniref:Helix-turn-helix transcriptional regulator n=1 Tax=Isoptericola sediminis TaxID=2733572 RepID=A0A849K6C8_9MICO|nr:helix-turn-helix transcriptional regulator [Isoptericola sediminis]
MPRAITLVSPEGATLGHALAAALASRGWTVMMRRTEGVLPDLGGQDVVVLVEDDHGNWTCRRPLAVGRSWICIGSVRSLPGLLAMQRRGAVVLNQSAPMLTLVCHVETAVTRAAPADLAVAALTLRRRLAERDGLNLLTSTEDAILRAMLAGASAAQIGLHRHASVNTVRTHIKAVLAKLGVRSQLEAVAVAHRAGCMEWLFDAMVKFTNSGDDDLVCGGRQ